MKYTAGKKALLFALAVVVFISVVPAGCGGTGNDRTNVDTGSQSAAGNGIPEKVLITGSTSVQPLVQDLADRFSETHNWVSIEVQGGGSTQGIKDVSSGVSDIGISSRQLKDSEKELGLTEHIIAYDGIAIAVHPCNKVENLTKDQVAAIFKGEIKNWKEVGGVDKEIIIVTREAGSGTRGAFEELLSLIKEENGKKLSAIYPGALVADGNGAVKANIATKENAIGYVSLGFVDESVKKIRVDGIECNVGNIKSGRYKISRSIIMLTKGEMKPGAKAFLDFILSDEGQEVVAESFITVK